MPPKKTLLVGENHIDLKKGTRLDKIISAFQPTAIAMEDDADFEGNSVYEAVSLEEQIEIIERISKENDIPFSTAILNFAHNFAALALDSNCIDYFLRYLESTSTSLFKIDYYQKFYDSLSHEDYVQHFETIASYLILSESKLSEQIDAEYYSEPEAVIDITERRDEYMKEQILKIDTERLLVVVGAGHLFNEYNNLFYRLQDANLNVRRMRLVEADSIRSAMH